MQLEQVNQEAPVPSSSIYRCTQCKQGYMYPTNQDGEPEYTDHFICNHCQHKDQITSVTVLWSQATTSSIGIVICFYLLLVQFDLILAASDSATQDASSKNIALIGLGISFLVGFCYVLLRAYRGFLHRKGYLNS